MSVLAPLYLLGLLAVSLPIVFHLIRRSPRGELPFSSTMFLAPSPPRLTRRSRLDNLLLLLLRAAALTLLAVAFARPFLRQAALLTLQDVGQERVAVLVDTSASMRRGDLWQQAIDKAQEIVARYRPQDELALFAFDDRLRTVATFEELAEVEPARRPATIRARLGTLEPSWGGTHLGQALGEALALGSDSRGGATSERVSKLRIVLISDVQSGSRLAALGEHAWPDDATLELVTLRPSDPTNAGLERLAMGADSLDHQESDRDKLRVRVINTNGSEVDQFRLVWMDQSGSPLGSPLDVYAPSGESRVTRMPLPSGDLAQPRLVLMGDAYDFDNTLYFLPIKQPELNVLYLGTDAASDPDGLRYYLETALESDASRRLHLQERAPDDPELTVHGTVPQLVVVTAPPGEERTRQLLDYVEQGGLLLYVVTADDHADALASLLGSESLSVADAEVDGYAMLGEIDFDHALFAPMAGPQFNDFTQIRFWKYRRLEGAPLDDATIVARFENGDPALLERQIGTGRLLLLLSGWHPSDSQLARSWKFLLMLSSLIDDNAQLHSFQSGYIVHDRVQLPEGIAVAEGTKIIKPDGESVLLGAADEFFSDTGLPGVYTLSTAEESHQFVVQLDPTESLTEPLGAEAFEQLGCQLSDRTEPERSLQQLQHLRDVELESRQKIWKVLVAVALAVLVLETVLAGWYTRRQEAQLATG